MKTGEEKFDDEIRQKLRHSEVNPPADFFDKIIPPNKNKRGFFWIWFIGIAILFFTIVFYEWNHKSPNEILSARESSLKAERSGSIKSVGNGLNNPDKSTLVAKNLFEEPSIQSNSFTENKTDYNSRYDQTNINRNSNSVHDKNDYSHDINSDYSSSSINPSNKTQSNLIYNSDLLFVPSISLPYTGVTKQAQHLKIHNPIRSEVLEFKSSPFALEVVLGRISYFNTLKSETNDTMANRLFSAGEDVFNSKNGFEAGIKILYDINNNFTFKFGVSYSKREDKFSFHFDEYYQSQTVDSIQYYILFPFSPPQLVTEYDTSMQLLSTAHLIEHKFSIQTFSTSFVISYNLPIGRFLISPEAGLIADFYSITKGSSNFTSDLVIRENNDYYKNGIRLNMNAGLQLTYAVTEKLGMFILTGYRYNLTSLNTEPKFYSDKTNSLLIGGGVKYNLIKKQAAKTEAEGSNK